MASDGQSCSDCGARFPAGALACPSCQKLVHAAELKRLAADARAAAERGEPSAELAAWRSALPLLPLHSLQHEQLRQKIDALCRGLDTPAAAPARPPLSFGKAGVVLSTVALVLWKAKALVLLLLTKGKLLLLGLTKAKTFFSMLLSMGVYFSLWGWKFAVGFVLSIYVHEMGHVAALRRLGIPASAPMFIPGFGAYVRLHQYPSTPAEDARVGLAGPIWGTAAALFCWLVFRGTGVPIWGALAHSGALINLFNLIPVWQLDGARGFHALDRRGRLIACATITLAWLASAEGFLVLLLLVAGYRAWKHDPDSRTDRRALLSYCGLVLVLAWLSTVDVPGLGAPVVAATSAQ